MKDNGKAIERGTFLRRMLLGLPVAIAAVVKAAPEIAEVVAEAPPAFVIAFLLFLGAAVGFAICDYRLGRGPST